MKNKRSLALSTTEINVSEFATHRPAMLRFARRKIRDEALAEDAVQEALAAAVAARDSFQGQSALKTWLIGILNHKIQVTFRREGRYVHLSNKQTSETDIVDLMNMQRSDIAEPAGRDPSTTVASWRLVEALEVAIDELPTTLREVFTLQALEGASTEDVCNRLDISEANCWVRLHRARKRLSDQMQAHLA